MTDTIAAMDKYLRKHESDMIYLLERLVNINSHSANVEGVNLVAAVLEATLRGMGFAVRRLANRYTGDNLVAENMARRQRGGGPLLVGHMDTVFPPEMGFDRMRREGNRIIGPGVSDMKGGLVVAIFAARALAAAGRNDLPIGFFFNADEEIGSPHSRGPIADEAKKSKFCMVMESSGKGGEVITGRKGRIIFDLTVAGKPSHAGHSPYPKPSAIVEMAHKIQGLEALNAPEEGISLNIGLVEGGVGPNTVAARCTARCETRFVDAQQGETVWKAIQELCAKPVLDGTSASLDIHMDRPPMVANDSILGLYELISDAAGEIGMEVSSVSLGGGSDANIVARENVPVVDGMGPAGDLFHTPEEFLETDSLVPQALLTAAAMLKGAERYS
ncbi:M20/M25/M40 family metallo-hydrolase [Pseudodesulfovibrio cashew]|uniref:M20/M25/M40 family metallo-hydrolase n=1 Tax=Pseudodesulfovibrio cashew TaxID=2678688 RepID=A0A6I6J7V5_9BACT|nr:M20 family metallopeptidase [Pseudodesulfovibrio cashew]QGY38916.1 M20/M25/M40 family metallo-hydrolase [Pseudodesulfovibrio cashew]